MKAAIATILFVIFSALIFYLYLVVSGVKKYGVNVSEEPFIEALQGFLKSADERMNFIILSAEFEEAIAIRTVDESIKTQKLTRENSALDDALSNAQIGSIEDANSAEEWRRRLYDVLKDFGSGARFRIDVVR